ncbi:MAG TPA: cation:proton antiporter [Polyangiaceae bacterium]|nr:cation:proton antiporter [Polyangiaceae bacterium]
MLFATWCLILGALLVVMALTGSFVKRLPLSTSVLYLGVGFALGAHGAGLFSFDPLRDATLLERLSEVAVLISLFTTGLKLSPAFDDRNWHLPLRLAFVSMTLTVALIAGAGVLLLGLPPGAAIVLGAVLAPTDPVLASDVQIAHHGDRDRLRFALTGEAGLNDGTAFPFVMLGLGLLGLHPLGPFGLRWLALDVGWAVAGGLGIGWLLGTAVGRVVLYLRSVHKEAVGLDEFLSLGLIGLSYGAALWARAYGFLAVFAAGLALRRLQQRKPCPRPLEAPAVVFSAAHELATEPEQAPTYMAQAVLHFNEQLERVAEVSLVLLVAGTLTLAYVPREALWFLPLLFLVIRPAAVALGTGATGASPLQRSMIGWFGIRGVGSIYYLTYAIGHGLPPEHARLITGLVLTAVAASIVAHGVSVTPLMNYYAAVSRRRRRSLA